MWVKKQNENLKTLIDSLNVKADDQVKTIVELSKQNSELSLQLAASTKTINDNITGGDSFVEFRIQPVSNDSARIIAIHHGKSPLFDIKVIFKDTDQKDIRENLIVNSSGTLLNVGNLQVGTGGVVGSLKCDFSDSTKKLFSQTSARNGSFTQTFTLIRTSGMWYSSTAISTLPELKQIFKSEDPNFPK